MYSFIYHKVSVSISELQLVENVPAKVIRQRLNKGWSVEDSAEVPHHWRRKTWRKFH